MLRAAVQALQYFHGQRMQIFSLIASQPSSSTASQHITAHHSLGIAASHHGIIDRLCGRAENGALLCGAGAGAGSGLAGHGGRQ